MCCVLCLPERGGCHWLCLVERRERIRLGDPTQGRTCDVLTYVDCRGKAKEGGVFMSGCDVRLMRGFVLLYRKGHPSQSGSRTGHRLLCKPSRGGQWRSVVHDCERFVCLFEALNLCDKIPGCTCAGLTAAECALVLVDQNFQTHKYEPRPSIEGEGRSRSVYRYASSQATWRKSGYSFHIIEAGHHR